MARVPLWMNRHCMKWKRSMSSVATVYGVQ